MAIDVESIARLHHGHDLLQLQPGDHQHRLARHGLRGASLRVQLRPQRRHGALHGLLLRHTASSRSPALRPHSVLRPHPESGRQEVDVGKVRGGKLLEPNRESMC